jgi:GntR family transcriptional regulator
MSNPLDRNSWEPLYYQIAARIRASVEGELSPGAQVPSENELINEYNVSRNTVRLAIESLIKEGLVYRVKGKGTFVSPERLQFGLFRLVSFTEETQRRGMHPSSRVINLTKVSPTPKIRQALNLQTDQQAFCIERLRIADEVPMAINHSFVPVHVCPALDQEDLVNGSIYRVIEEKYHLRIGYARQKLKPAVATEVEARLLEIAPGSPLLVVEGVACLVDNTPVEYARLIYRGDRYEFPIQAVRQSWVYPTKNQDDPNGLA